MADEKPSRSGSPWAFRLLTIGGIPIEIHASFLLLMVFLGWRTWMTSGLHAAVIEQLLVVAVFVCVGLHELGHAVVALRNGVAISGITLYPFGGLARMTRRPPNGRVEVAIAAAGPAVNLAIAGGLLLVSGGSVLNPAPSLVSGVLKIVFWANLILAGFNLLPAFPLDGGRVLRGLLTSRMGWARATVWAASVGQIAGVMLLLFGFLHDAWLILAGLLVLPAANAELRYALALRQFTDRTVGELARKALVRIGIETTLSEAAELSVAQPEIDFLVVDKERIVGYLPAARLWSHLRSDERGIAPVGRLAAPVAGPIPGSAAIEDATDWLPPGGPEVAVVADERGAVVGIVGRGDLLRAAQLARHAVAR
jgi:stage IV sporulation protein FB